MKQNLRFKNVFRCELIRDGKIIDIHESENLVTIEGANEILDVFFDDASDGGLYYIGLISGASPTLDAADTLASHAGWTEFTDYSGNRQQYNPDQPSGGSCVNATNVCQFTITGAGTIGGAFLCEVSSGTSGVLFSETAYPSGYSVVVDDIYRVTYTMSLVSS